MACKDCKHWGQVSPSSGKCTEIFKEMFPERNYKHLAEVTTAHDYECSGFEEKAPATCEMTEE